MQYFAQAITNPSCGHPELLILDSHNGDYGPEPGSVVDRTNLVDTGDGVYDVDRAMRHLGYYLVGEWETADYGSGAIVETRTLSGTPRRSGQR